MSGAIVFLGISIMIAAHTIAQAMVEAIRTLQSKGPSNGAG